MKKRRKLPGIVAEYELKDYRGKTVVFNNHGAERMFGTPTPDEKTLQLVEKILQHPDWVFKTTQPYQRLHLIKRVSGNDYLLNLSMGYGEVKSQWMLFDFEIIKVKKVERNTLYYDQPRIWCGIKLIYPKPGKHAGDKKN